MKQAASVLFLLGVLAATTPASASDWPQFRGPQRNGVSPETGWTAKWPEAGPKRLWSAELGHSYASTLIYKGRAYVLGSTPQQDTVACLEAETGKEVWKVAFPHGPRAYVPDSRPNALTATPLIQNDRLYVLAREGEFLCLNAKNGEVVWRTNLLQETGAKLPQFGLSCSPILEGDLLLCNIGTGGASVNKNTGKVVWKTGGTGGYASPILYTRNGKREAALFGDTTVVGVEALTGQERWRFPWRKTAFGGAPSGDPILTSAGLFVCASQEGSKLLNLQSETPTVVWQNRNLCSDFTNSVLLGKYLYGNNRNKLACLDIQTGEIRWEEKGLGQGSLIAAGGKLIVLTERGELVVAEATPNKYTELARTKLFEGKDFFGSAGYIAPTLANGLLYCRNSSGALVCLDLREK
jgi:outer membrane protein assembly factor BamB